MPTGQGASEDFRRRLDEIICQSASLGLDWQIDAIGRIKPQYPHSITLREKAPLDPEPTYNCFQHALDLIDMPQLPWRRGIKFPDTQFVRHAITGLGSQVPGILKEVDMEAARPGDIVVYEPSWPAHAGKIHDGGRVISKWGRGNLWEHAVDEVPWAYGTTWQSFTQPAPGTVRQSFEVYADLMGWT